MATPNLRRALMHNPPPKCPYFSLPDVKHLPEEALPTPNKNKANHTISDLWGPYSKMTDESTTNFLLQLLKYSQWTPDFEAVAEAWNLSSTARLKARFKKIVEGKGYGLEDESKVVGGEVPARRPPKKVPGAKKRKTTEAVLDDLNDDTKADKVKKPKPSGKKHEAKKSNKE